MGFDLKSLQNSPSWKAVETIFTKLDQAGYLVYLAGGCVRDTLIGREVHDLDVVTDAPLDFIKKNFRHVILVGESFGVLRVREFDQEVEVAQFRQESDYRDGRRPSLVQAAPPQKDAERRDFTMNALFFDLKTHQLLDYVGAQKDIEKKLIRCVGDPRKRFSEDHLRLLRAVRFEAQLNFSLDEETKNALIENAGLVSQVSAERIREELIKILTAEYSDRGVQELFNLGLARTLFPNLPAPHPGLFKEKVRDVDLALTLFLWKAPGGEDFLEKMKWPKKSERKIVQVLKCWNSLSDFFKLRRGEQIILASEKLFRKFGCVLETRGVAYPEEKEIQQLVIETKRNLDDKGELVGPLVVASDFQGRFKGSELGLRLKECYLTQLEQPSLNKSQILHKVIGNENF